jgi:hypothetical protein
MVDADTHLAMARKDVETGDRYVAEGDYELARFYYERAQGEADVAIAQARAKTAENKVALLEKEVDREEVED